MSLLSNRRSLLIAMVTASAVFVMFGYMTLKPEQKTTQQIAQYNFVITKRDIKKGEVIKDEDVAMKSFPINIQGAYKATGEIVGRKAKADIGTGKPVMSDFIEKPKAQATSGDFTPNVGFRAVPVLITTDVVPKDISPDLKFDLIAADNSMRVENVRILDVVNTQSGKKQKIVLLEIKSSEVQLFLDSFERVKGINILRKNPEDYGEYKFETDLPPIVRRKRQNIVETIDSPSMLPSVSKLEGDPFNEYVYKRNNQVEVIVGNSKKTMEFSE